MKATIGGKRVWYPPEAASGDRLVFACPSTFKREIRADPYFSPR